MLDRFYHLYQNLPPLPLLPPPPAILPPLIPHHSIRVMQMIQLINDNNDDLKEISLLLQHLLQFSQQNNIQFSEQVKQNLKSISASIVHFPPVPPPPCPPPRPYFVSKILNKTKCWGVGRGNSSQKAKRTISHPVDLYEKWRKRPQKFYWRTRMSVEEYDRLFKKTQFIILTQTRRRPATRKITEQNRLLILIHWMAHHQSYDEVGEKFGVSEGTVKNIIYFMIPVVLVATAGSVSWDSIEQNGSALGENIGAAIDCSHMLLEKPAISQGIFYRRDVKDHSEVLQMVVTLTGKIVHAAAGFPGSFNDRRVLQVSGLHFGDVGVLADGGYRYKIPQQVFGSIYTPEQYTGKENYIQRSERFLVLFFAFFIFLLINQLQKVCH